MPNHSTKKIDDMTELEKLEIERRAIEERITEAKNRNVSNSLRASCVALQDESLPIAKIFSEAVYPGNLVHLDHERLHELSERFAHIIKVHTEREHSK